MNPIEHVKRLFADAPEVKEPIPEQAAAEQAAPMRVAAEPRKDLFFSPRLFFAIQQKCKVLIADINIKLIPCLNAIDVKDEDLSQFYGIPYKELESELINYLVARGMVKGMSENYVKEQMQKYKMCVPSMFDRDLYLYSQEPNEIPDTILPYVTVKHDDEGKRYIALDEEGLKILACVVPTKAQLSLIAQLEELTRIMNNIKQGRGYLYNQFLQFIISDYTNNTCHVDKEWIITNLKDINPYMNVNLYDLVDPTQTQV